MNNKKAKICMNAMVANEAKTITRMLDSVYKYIDYWVVQDNGSTDGTQDIIRNYFAEKGIPGFLYETEWHYPGYNRDHALQTCLKSDHGCDWILRMDADERLHVDDDFDWSVMDDTSIESFHITAQNGDVKYLRTWFWNAKLPWFFQHDKRHETIHLPERAEDFQRVVMPIGFRHLVSQDGQTWYVPRKFLRDALELEIDKVVGNTVNEDTYHLWYIAKSYADCYGNPNELPFGREHSIEYGRRAIWYYNMFLNKCHNWSETKQPKYKDEMAYFTFLSMGDIYKFMGDLEKAKETYAEANKFFPERNEHWLYTVYILRSEKKYKEAIELLDHMMNPSRVNPWPNCTFLVESRAYVNTGDHLKTLKEEISNQMDQPEIVLESVKFEFN
jgi:glycosyltransferase involved in cell wall biosynthesis